MLCLTESIRPNDPAMQRLCRAVGDARARTALIVAVWKLARVLVLLRIGEIQHFCAMRPSVRPAGPTSGRYPPRLRCVAAALHVQDPRTLALGI